MSTLEETIQRLRDRDYNPVRSMKPMSFGSMEQCKRLFYKAFMLSDETARPFKLVKGYEEVLDWMTDTKGQGLLLTGPCGIGKSVILRGVIPLIFLSVFDKIVKVYSARNLQDVPRNFTGFNAFDDIGIEPLISNRYGEKSVIFCDIVDRAEEILMPIFVSTNLSGEQLLERYGERTVDRLMRLCRPVKLSGETLRY